MRIEKRMPRLCMHCTPEEYVEVECFAFLAAVLRWVPGHRTQSERWRWRRCHPGWGTPCLWSAGDIRHPRLRAEGRHTPDSLRAQHDPLAGSSSPLSQAPAMNERIIMGDRPRCKTRKLSYHKDKRDAPDHTPTICTWFAATKSICTI